MRPKGGLDLANWDLDSISFEGGEISFSDVKGSSSLQSSLNSSIERLSDILEDALLDVLSDSRKVFITFDKIDEAWDTSSFEASPHHPSVFLCARLTAGVRA